MMFLTGSDMPRNFAIRLRCPHGDSDSWVTLFNREESLEQILKQTWEFKCRDHGPQKGIPQEAMEVAPLDDPPPSQSVQSTFAIPFPAATEKKTPRSSERVPMRVPVVVYGYDRQFHWRPRHAESQTRVG